MIHTTLPKSIENYYQESGRAGRDGLQSHSVLFYQYSDKKGVEYLINSNKTNKCKKTEEKRTCEYNQLNQMITYCEDKFECRRLFQLKYFGEKFNKS